MTTFSGNRFFIICLLLLSVGIFAAGCNITNKLYLYTQPGVDYDWGFVAGRMNETYTTTRTESIASSPYVLAILFRLNSKAEGGVTITSVELTDADGNKTFYESDEPLIEIFEAGSDGVTYDASFRIRDLKPDYVRLRLRLKYKIETDRFVKEDETDLYFDMIYKEWRSNKTWDRFMGV